MEKPVFLTDISENTWVEFMRGRTSIRIGKATISHPDIRLGRTFPESVLIQFDKGRAFYFYGLGINGLPNLASALWVIKFCPESLTWNSELAGPCRFAYA